MFLHPGWVRGGGKNDRIRTIEPYRVYMDSRRANVIGSQMGLF